MSVTVALIEGNTVVCKCILTRVPCAYEKIVVNNGYEYRVTSVRHFVDYEPVAADVRVTRFYSKEEQPKP